MRKQLCNELIIVEVEREIMYLVDFGSFVILLGDDYWDDDDLVEVLMFRMCDNIKVVCIENGIVVFSFYVFRKFC